jgi:hypothetical protein
MNGIVPIVQDDVTAGIIVPFPSLEEPSMCQDEVNDQKNQESNETNSIQDRSANNTDDKDEAIVHPLLSLREKDSNFPQSVSDSDQVVDGGTLEPLESMTVESLSMMNALQKGSCHTTIKTPDVLKVVREEHTEHPEQDSDDFPIVMMVSPQPTLGKKAWILEPSPTSVLDTIIPFSSDQFPTATTTTPESNLQQVSEWDPPTTTSEQEVCVSSNNNNDTSLEIVGTVTPFADFLAQQSMLKKQQRHRERQARESLHTIAPEPSSGAAVASQSSEHDHAPPAGSIAGTIMSRVDFERYQRQLDAAQRQQERQARNQLHRPAKPIEVSNQSNGYRNSIQDVDDVVDPLDLSNSSNDALDAQYRKIPDLGACWDSSSVSSSYHKEFLAQDAASRIAAELKRLAQEQKKKEREAREIMDSFRYQPDAIDAATRVAADLKKLSLEQKQKEHEAKAMVTSYRLVENGTDLSMQLAADLKRRAQEQKQKEREAREMVASYHVADDGAADAASRLAVDLKRMAQEQKKKEREAKEMVTSYRIMDSGPVDAVSCLAAEMKRLGLEQKQKEKEARELVASYRIADDGSMDAAARVAADLKRLAQEQRQKEREARGLVASYRHGDVGEGDAIAQVAANLKRLAQEQKQKEKEAREMVASYHHVDDGTGDAASRVAMNLRHISQEQKRKEKEAKEMIQSYRQSQYGAGDAADLVAAELKRISQEQKKKEREAKKLASSFCFVDLEARTPAEKVLLEERLKRKVLAEEKLRQMEASAAEEDHEPLNNLVEIQNRIAAELLAVEDERKKKESMNFSVSESVLEQIRLQTTAELSALAAKGNHAKDIAGEFHRGIKTTDLDEIKSRRATELIAIEEERKKREDDHYQTSCCKALEQIQSQKAAELAALLERCANAQQLAEEFQRIVKSTAVHEIKSRTAAELLAIQEERKKNEILASERCDNVSVLEQIQSQKAQELAILQENGNSKSMAEEFLRAGTTTAMDEIKSRTSAELLELQVKSEKRKEALSFHITKENKDILKANTQAELSMLKGKSNLMKSLFVQSTSKNTAEKIKSKAASELSSLQGKSSEIKNLLEQNASQSSADSIKAKTAVELMALKGNGTKQLACKFVLESKNRNRVEKLKSQTAAELSILQRKEMGAKSIQEEILWRQKDERLERLKSQTHAELEILKGKSAKELAKEFCHQQDGKVQSIKQQTAAELAAVKAALEQRKKLVEDEASRSSDSVKENNSIPSSFSADILAAFERERREMESQLEERRRKSAYNNNLSAIHAQRSKELQTLTAKKNAAKKVAPSQTNGTGKKGGLVLNTWMDSELEKLKLERMQREREIEELKARSSK